MAATPSPPLAAPQEAAQAAYVAAYAALRRYGRRWATLSWIVTELRLSRDRTGSPAFTRREVADALARLADDGLIDCRGRDWRAA